MVEITSPTAEKEKNKQIRARKRMEKRNPRRKQKELPTNLSSFYIPRQHKYNVNAFTFCALNGIGSRFQRVASRYNGFYLKQVINPARLQYFVISDLNLGRELKTELKWSERLNITCIIAYQMPRSDQ